MHRMRRQIVFGIFTTVVLAITALGQNAELSGQVTDPVNAVVTGAKVYVLNQETLAKIEAKTDPTGRYRVPYLSPGRYRITIQAPGFRLFISQDIVLAAAQAVVLNAQLALIGAKEEVTIESGGPDRVETESAEVSGTITQKEMVSFGLNGRNFTQLIALAPGVSNQTGQDEARVGVLGSVSYSVNGGRTEYNSFLVDGSDVLNAGMHKDNTALIVTPSIDGIQELKVLTSNYGAMYPSTGNATTIIVTKSGSDHFHGDLYEFLRNEDLNAKGFFDIGNSAPLYRRSDFGGTFGGPVILPGLYDGRKNSATHFFFSEEARLEKDPYAYRRAVPSLAQRNGDFSDVCPYAPPGVAVPIDDSKTPDCPSYGSVDLNYQYFPQTFPGNQMPLVSPLATALLNTGVIPAPNAASGCNSTIGYCYNMEVSLPTYYREELFRLDHYLNQKSQLSFRYIHDEWSTTTPVPQWGIAQNTFPTIRNQLYGPGLSLVARMTHAWSTTLFNEFVASYTDSYITLRNQAAPTVSLQRSPVFDQSMGYLFNNGFGGKIPGIVIGGNNAAYGGSGFVVDPSYMPWEHTSPTYAIADNISKTIGRHSLQAGLQWIFFQRNQVNGSIGAATGDVQGLMTFSNEASTSTFTTGNAFADFIVDQGIGSYGMLGGVASFQQDSAQRRYYQRYQTVEAYFQDTWKVSPRFTAVLGLRAGMFGTYRDKGKNAYNWDPSAYSKTLAETILVDPYSGQLLDVNGAPIPLYENDGSVNPQVINGIRRCGANRVPSGCMSGGYALNPGPRIGLAWDPFGKAKTALRAGYGIFFERGTPDEANTGSLEGGAPLVLSATQLNPGPPACIGNIGPIDGHPGCGHGPGAFPINVTSIPTHAVWPYVQQWSLGLEHELPGSVLSTLSYVASKGTHLTAELQLNQLQPVPAAENPFPVGQPMNVSYCGGFGQNAYSPLQNTYQLPWTTIYPTSPAYINMSAACFVGNPNAFRENYAGLGQIYSLQNVANSSYHALQATLRRTKGPLTLGLAYTYSHSLDDASDRSDTTFVNSFDLKSNRASSNFDQRHLLHISCAYELPALRSSFFGSSLLADTFRGWELSGITLFESGTPFSVINGASPNGISVPDNAGVANGVGIGAYPDLVGNPYGPVPKGGNNSSSFGPLLLNPGAYAAPRGLTFGDAGRNSLNNPNRLNFDAAVLRHFRIRERFNLELRGEAFNLFNQTQFRIYNPNLGNQPNNTISCYAGSKANYSAAGGGDVDCLTGSSFLHPVDAHRPRTVQLGLKLAF
jgi:hypothetical protein